MNLFLNCFSLICLFAVHYSYGAIENCTSPQLNFHSESHFTSYKQDGRKYRCKCHGSNCEKIRCRKIRTVTEIPRNGRIISGSLEGQREENIVVQRTAPFLGEGEVSDSCEDTATGMIYQRGSTFVLEKTGSPRRVCECPYFGRPELICRIAQCRMPDPPYHQRPIFRQVNSCFDSWQNREVTHGTKYNRTQMMSRDGQTTAQFSCSCFNTVIRCTTIDVPCCNLETSRFVRKNESFLTLLEGAVHRCTCAGGKGSFTACSRIEDEQTCIDKQNPRLRHAVNSSWIRTKRNALWSCMCLRMSTNTLGIKCNFRSFLTRRPRSQSTINQDLSH